MRDRDGNESIDAKPTRGMLAGLVLSIPLVLLLPSRIDVPESRPAQSKPAYSIKSNGSEIPIRELNPDIVNIMGKYTSHYYMIGRDMNDQPIIINYNEKQR